MTTTRTIDEHARTQRRARGLVQQAVRDAWLECLAALRVESTHGEPVCTAHEVVGAHGAQRSLMLLQVARQAVWAELLDRSPATQREQLMALGIEVVFDHRRPLFMPIANTLHASSGALRRTLLAGRARAFAILESLLAQAPELSIDDGDRLRAGLFATRCLA